MAMPGGCSPYTATFDEEEADAWIETTRSGTTLAIGDDGISLGETSVATLEDFSLSPDPGAIHKQRELMNNLTKENSELRRHIKRRTKALDTVRRAYIVDVERLKRSLRDHIEGQSATEPEDLDASILGGIPSLDFRPVLELFAPTGDKLQMSPCEECGGTMEIVHYDEKEVVKLKRQINTLREELAESGEKLGYSNAVAETYRLKAESASSEFEELNNMLLREIALLKDKLVGAGPEVVTKILEEKDKAESRIRSAKRTVSELETVVTELRGQLERVAESDIKVAEMEYHLLEGCKEAKNIAAERDTHASTADELRMAVASLEGDLRHAADRNASLEKAFQDHEKDNRNSIAKLRKLLDNSKTNEATLLDELTALREENLHNMLASECDDGENGSDERSRQENHTSGCAERPMSQLRSDLPRTSFYGEPDVVLPPPLEEGDKISVFELTEGLRRKEEEVEYLREKLKKQDQDRDRVIDKGLVARELEAARKQAGAVRTTVERTAAVGEDILSGAYVRREEQAAVEKAQLRALLANVEAQANKFGRENKKLLKMWNDTRARLVETERAIWSGEAKSFHATNARETAKSKTASLDNCEESAQRGPRTSTGKGRSGRATVSTGNKAECSTAQGRNSASISLVGPSAPPSDASAKKIDIADKNAGFSPSSPPSEKDNASDASLTSGISDDHDVDDVMAVAMTYLQEDGRRLQKEKGELQESCKTLRESLESAKSILENERQGKQEAEQELETRRELLSMATLAAAEHSMALHDAQEGMGKVEEELELEKKDAANMRLELRELGAVNDVLEADLAATKSSLKLMTIAKSKAEASADQKACQAKRNALEAAKNAVDAENNAAWAEAEGMRAEEISSRCLVSDLAAAENIAALGVELKICEHELKRRRREAKEHGEQMKEFRQVVTERTKLEEEVQSQHQTISDVREKSNRDQAIIEEFKLEVVLLDGMRQEVLRLEARTEQLQTQLVVTTSSLEAAKNNRKVAEQQLRERTKLSRALWVALGSVVCVVDDWCGGPLLAWREADPAATQALLPKLPFEARDVEDIMALRRLHVGISVADADFPNLGPPVPPGDVAGAEARISIQEKLEGQQPKDIAAWLQFRVHKVAGMEHSNRADNARSEQLLLESTCKQRAAQVLNMEEALRKLEVARAALQDESNKILIAKEELSQVVLKQNEALLDNSKELEKLAVLKVDHLAEVRQHQKAIKRLQVAEGEIRGLKITLETAIGAASMAKNNANEAEYVRAAAVEDREAAAAEAKTARRAIERMKEQKEELRKKLHNLVRADATRLATNRTMTTEVPYGDLTDEAGTMTMFLCPELTMRHLKRLPPPRGLAPESTGRVVPALKYREFYDHSQKRECPHKALNHVLQDLKSWKREPGAPTFSSPKRPLCRIPSTQAGGACASCGTRDLLKFPTSERLHTRIVP